MRIGALAGIAAIVLLTEAAVGQEYPLGGIGYNTREPNVITYDCRKRSDENRIDCKFVLINIRKTTKPEDLPKRLNDAKTQFPKALKYMEKPRMCEQISEMLTTTRTGSVYGSLEAWAEFCKTRDEKSFLAITKRQFEIDSKTCTVGAHSFEQSFKWIDGYNNGKGAWVVDDKRPLGTCGEVHLSRFEIGESKNKFWNYIARMVVVNLDREVLGKKCSDFDQTEYLYSWQKPENPRMSCEWIDYSPF